jgi:hypothetical protein
MFVEDLINDGFMVKTRSSRLVSLVGSLWTCVIPMLVLLEGKLEQGKRRHTIPGKRTQNGIYNKETLDNIR